MKGGRPSSRSRVESKALRQIVQAIRVVVTPYAGHGSPETDTEEKLIFVHHPPKTGSKHAKKTV